MATVLHYRALDERGEEILNELEQRLEFRSTPGLQQGERSYFLLGSGEIFLDVSLSAIDVAWQEHVVPVDA